MSAPVVDRETVDRYVRAGYWGTRTLVDVIRDNVARRPDDAAFIEGDDRMTWREYDARSTRIAAALVGAGLEPGERVGVQLRDGPTVHAVYVGLEKAGLTAVGLGLRAGARELRHLLSKSGAVGLIGEPVVRGVPAVQTYKELRRGLPLRAYLVPSELEAVRADDRSDALIEERRLGPNDAYMLNSTSGTTGLPKIVVQFQNRWFAFHQLAESAAALTPDDVFMSLVSAPYGFAQWTAKFTPAIMGGSCVLHARFDADSVLESIERHRVSVLMCVSTQFVMLLNSPNFAHRDLSSLRCMFTGGEAIPYDRALEFEHATGAKVLQFFGSNETGALSHTTLEMDADTRLRTAGHVIPYMDVRLFDGEGNDVTVDGGPGQPGCRGPLTSVGYYEDPDANEELFTSDGWMLTGDICTLDGPTLRLVGRTSDFIIRGGKNVSAAAVEEDVGSHPAVALAAAVPMPDAVFGEKVACYVVLKPGESLELTELQTHLKARGVSVESWPEHLIFVDSLPMSSGGKIAKAELRADITKWMVATREEAT